MISRLHPRRATLLSGLKKSTFVPILPCRRVFGPRFYSEGPTVVEKILLDNIKATGPFPFSTYMSLCLLHPTAGYYTNPQNAVFGTQGDFITSPEISQVFGELLGVWLLSNWAKAATGRSQPPKIRLIELGPGRGTLMNDVLRTFAQFTPAGTVQSIELVESSRTLREVQKTLLGSSAEAGGYKLVWHDVIDEIEPQDDVYTMVVAHEFFDALPIHVLKKTKNGWREIFVASQQDAAATPPSSPEQASILPPEQGAAQTSRLQRVLAPGSSMGATVLGNSSPRFENVPEDATLEVSPTSYRTARHIGELITSDTGLGGCALIVDYGADNYHEDSFRAFKNHKMVDIFHRPGECDLTADVDFRYLKESVADLSLATHGPIDQGVFLERMGMQLRVDALKKSATSEERKRDIEKAAERLADRSGMGKQYRVLGLTSKRASSSKQGNPEDEVWPFVDWEEPHTESGGPREN